MDTFANSYPSHEPPITLALVNQEVTINEETEGKRLSTSQTKIQRKGQKKHISTQSNAQTPLPRAAYFTGQPVRTPQNLSGEFPRVYSLQIGSLYLNPSTLKHNRRSENHTPIDSRDGYQKEAPSSPIFAKYHNLNYDHSEFPKHLYYNEEMDHKFTSSIIAIVIC